MDAKKRVIILGTLAIVLALIATLLSTLGEEGQVATTTGDNGISNSEGSGQVLLIVKENPNVEDKGTTTGEELI